MMGGFVHPEGAARLPQAMPSAKIRCPVVGIQIPGKLHRGKISNGLLFQELFDPKNDPDDVVVL